MQGQKDQSKEEEHYWPHRHIKIPTIHLVTFGIAHIETGSLHVCRKDIPPFILITQGGLSACWTLLTCCGKSTTGEHILETTQSKQKGGIK